LSCLGPEYTPTHMTVDRTGTAWVAAWVVDQNSALFETSSLYTASTANAACTKVANWIPQPGGNFSDFALTFIGTNQLERLHALSARRHLGPRSARSRRRPVRSPPSAPQP